MNYLIRSSKMIYELLIEKKIDDQFFFVFLNILIFRSNYFISKTHALFECKIATL